MQRMRRMQRSLRQWRRPPPPLSRLLPPVLLEMEMVEMGIMEIMAVVVVMVIQLVVVVEIMVITEKEIKMEEEMVVVEVVPRLPVSLHLIPNTWPVTATHKLRPKTVLVVVAVAVKDMVDIKIAERSNSSSSTIIIIIITIRTENPQRVPPPLHALDHHHLQRRRPPPPTVAAGTPTRRPLVERGSNRAAALAVPVLELFLVPTVLLEVQLEQRIAPLAKTTPTPVSWARPPPRPPTATPSRMTSTATG